MTALAGVVGFASAENLKLRCRAALDAQRLYGGGNTALSGAANVVFGLDLRELVPEDRFCREPLSNERFLLVADARLDNRLDIVRALGASAEGFSRKSDAEVLFAAWDRWGEDCLQLIVGDYAFAVYDHMLHRLTLARDPSGQRPLFYERSGDAICFASMPSGVLAGSRLQHDMSYLTAWLSGTPVVDDRTCFLNVSRVHPGHLVTFCDAETRRKRFWQPQTEGLPRLTKEALVESYRFHLDQAVGSRMRRASGPLATHLSSGFDSSAVTATAARLAKPDERIVAFTSAPALTAQAPLGRPTDETGMAAATARMYGLEHIIVRTGGPLLDTLRGHARYYQEPVQNVLNQGWWKQISLLAEAKGAMTLLTGQMGNATLNAGGLWILSEWLRKGDLVGWFREARAAVRRPDTSWRGMLMHSFEPWMPNRVSRELKYFFLGIRPLSAAFVRSDGGMARLPRKPVSRVRHVSQVCQRLASITGMDFGLLRKGELAETGVDLRDPTADRRLVEFSFSIPREQLLHNGRFRPLATAALSDRLPEAILTARSRGYQGADWYRRLTQKDAFNVLEEISQSSTAQELLDLPRLWQRVSHWPELDGGSLAGLVAGRELTNALAMGVFVVETERYPDQMGR